MPSRDPRVQVLGLLHRCGALTRADLAAHLGVSTAMAGEWIADLVHAGLISDAGKGESRGGRPPRRVMLAGETVLVVGIDLSGWPVRAVVGDLAGRVRFETSFGMGSTPAPDASAESMPPDLMSESRDPSKLPPSSPSVVAQVVRSVIRHSGLPGERVRAVGVALAGFVDPRRGIHRSQAALGAPAIPLADEVSAELGLPVLVEDVARASALAEAHQGAAASVADLLFLSIGDRIGAALILDGHLYRGAAGVVGELGHIVVDENGLRCSCGNRGCLQTVASRPAILRQARDALAAGVQSGIGRDVRTPLSLDLAVIAEAARQGDRLATSILGQAGQNVGRALAAGANLLGPTMVVLGGYAPSLGSIFADEVRHALKVYVVPPIWERLTVDIGTLGVDAGALGAAWSAIDLLVASGALVQPPGQRRPRRARLPAGVSRPV